MVPKEALIFFKNYPRIYKKLTVLSDVGLGYIKLGQSAITLSGGEAQRIKLAKELIRPDTGHTLYVLDEPTTGLHNYDVKNLLKVDFFFFNFIFGSKRSNESRYKIEN